MAFTGKYVLESQENYEEFLKALGIEDPKDTNNDEIITDIYQNDDFRLTKFLMDKTWNNTFSIGQESELETMDGETFKTTVTLDGGKLKIQFPKYIYTAEVAGDKLIEVNTIGAVTNKMISKKTK
ncbi:gastrotropin-like [Siniperca chuatsi]|uniref:gastrotropin-like n=1 Tax=Siniperca chuatsi TaxID=119488 RepID=UPI001CE11AD3|nr:gastrotropin-like [Siniperca chuatsi]USU43504.1 Fabp6c [Siniperca chuatsi]